MRKLLLIITLLLTACAPIVTQPVLPTPTRPPVTPTVPTAAWADLSPYYAAMKPDFVHDVDQFTQATRYQIDLTIAPSLTNYTATQQVHYFNTATAPLDAVYFRLFPNTPSYGGKMTITSLKVNGAEVKPSMELGDSAMRIKMDPPLPVDGEVDFDLAYVTSVPTVSIPGGYEQFGYFRGVLAIPNFFPMIPTYDDEGWNVELAPGWGDSTYSDSALFQVNLTAPSDQVIATSGTCGPAKISQGSQTLHCASGPMRDFMIGLSADYQVASDTIDGIKVNSYYLKKDQEAGRRGLEISVKAVKSYEKRIGPYPFNELDVLETPTSAGGIEYPGLVVIAAEDYQHNPTFQEDATAHEVAHQWWYSLVGDDQLDDPWLDEAFTQFTTALYYLDVYGSPGFQADISLDLQARYQRALSDNEDMRADLPVAAYSDRQYGEIVYGKAPLFFYALYQKMGDEKYNAFMQTYFEANRYRNAHVPDLLKAIATQLDQATIDQLMKQWITTPN